MAVGVTAPVPVPAVEERGFQWTLTLLPAFPIVLLVLRLWHLSKQDQNTMLVLVQNVGPLDLVSSLVISLMWVPPLMLLTGHALALLYVVSAPREAAARPSWLTRTAARTPDWVVAFAVMWAGVTWQLRFLPLLSLLALMILGLTVRSRFPGRRGAVIGTGVVLPVAVLMLEYLWFAGAVGDALPDEFPLALLLLAPPALAPLLTGPLPERFARLATHLPAVAALLVGPFVLIAIFLRTPVLPSVAMQLTDDRVVLGYVVTIDDTATTLLDDDGTVSFVPNDAVEAKVLCGGAEQVPYSDVSAHGWHVEQSMLEWFLPRRPPGPLDEVRCAGRPR